MCLITPKKILFLLVSIFYLAQLNAQYKFGIHGGLGYSNYLGKDYPITNNPILSPFGGIYYEHDINLTISISTEVNYEIKGASYYYEPKVATKISIDNHSSYISVPLLIKAYFDYNSFTFVYLGASAEFLTSSSMDVAATEYGYHIESKPFFNYQMRKFDVAAVGGLGLNFKEIILDLRFHYGTMGIYKGNNSPDVRNMYISASIGYSLYKKKVLRCINSRRRMKDL